MRSDIVYLYDGSYEGLLCCVFESFLKKERPLDIIPKDFYQMTLYESRIIPTDFHKADRVINGIRKKSDEAASFTELCYYTCHEKKEILILDFIGLLIKYGKNTLSMLTNDTVNELTKAVRSLTMESHQLKGFVRFSINGCLLSAVIEPKNFVLPLIAPHFCDRYNSEAFIIYDISHGFALIYKPFEYDIIPIEKFDQPEKTKEEQKFRKLWKLFYDTIAIKERENPRCRMSHMQKRYWNRLTEMNDSLLAEDKVKNILY